MRGALSSQVFDEEPDGTHRTFLIFSDMRQSTPDLNLETAGIAPSFATVAGRCGTLPQFKDVQVYVLGVDGARKSTAYWQSLQGVWKGYLHNARAFLQTYSVMRDLQQ